MFLSMFLSILYISLHLDIKTRPVSCTVCFLNAEWPYVYSISTGEPTASHSLHVLSLSLQTLSASYSPLRLARPPLCVSFHLHSFSSCLVPPFHYRCIFRLVLSMFWHTPLFEWESALFSVLMFQACNSCCPSRPVALLGTVWLLSWGRTGKPVENQ